MKILQICPHCLAPAHKVNNRVIKFFLKDELLCKYDDDLKYYACSNEQCDVAYYSDIFIISIHDIKFKLWYKDRGLDVPLCYCAYITRSDIIAAVKNGCSSFSEVRTYCKKNRKGYCKEENPLGKCCIDVVQFYIEQQMKKIDNYRR